MRAFTEVWTRRRVSDELLQDGAHNVADARDLNNFQFAPNIFRNLLQISFVASGQHDAMNAGAMGGEHFLLYAPDRKNQT